MDDSKRQLEILQGGGEMTQGLQGEDFIFAALAPAHGVRAKDLFEAGETASGVVEGGDGFPQGRAGQVIELALEFAKSA